MAFEVCVNMVATALGRCEFRTFRENKETFEREYYLWNISPNANQNSTDFIHKLIYSLFHNNETLVVELPPHDGTASLVVADGFSLSKDDPSRPNEYRDVRIGDTTLQKVYRERNVLHFKLNEQNIKPVIDAMTESYSRLLSAAERYYRRTHGSQWKVHVDQIQSGQENWRDDFSKMLSNQMKPFLNGDNAVLPEFDGYSYSDVTRQSSVDSTDCRNLCEEIFNQTARGFVIPIVLSGGKVEATGDANNRFLTYCIDPICDQLAEEITRKHYGYDEWARGNFIRVDSSSIFHFDMFANIAIPGSENSTHDFSFMSGGKNFVKLVWSPTNEMAYVDASGNNIWALDLGTWMGNYKTIYVSTDQTVSAEFYNWFTANTTKN